MILLFLSLTFDRIVAGVENEAITSSFVEEVSPLYQGLSQREIVRKLVEERILFRIAQEESIVVTSDELNDAYSKMLEANPGLSFIKGGLDTLYRKELRYQLVIQKLLQKEVVPFIHITRGEIEEFYNAHKDSFYLPPSVTLRKITFELSPEEKERLLKKAEEIVNRFEKGESFEVLAEKYSEDPSTKYGGGRLGEIPLVTIPPYFNGVDTISAGKTGIFISPLGVHIIKVNGKKPGILDLSHILLKFNLDKNAIEKGIKRGNEVRKKWIEGDTLDMEIETVGPIPVSYMDENLSGLLDTLEIGEVSKPIVEGNTVTVFKVIEKKEGRIPPLEEIEQQVYNILFNRKLEEGYKKLLDRASEKVFYIIFL